MGGNTTENLNLILECPVCFDEYGKKEVYQCPDGHSVCSNCIGKCKQCPECRVKMPKKKIRNRALEFICSHSGTIAAGPQPQGNVKSVKKDKRPHSNGPLMTKKPGLNAAQDAGPPLSKKANLKVIHDAFCDGPKCNSRHGTPNDPKIHGVRYKCAICEDFDLCENCKTASVHSHHPFILFETTLQYVSFKLTTMTDIWRIIRNEIKMQAEAEGTLKPNNSSVQNS